VRLKFPSGQAYASFKSISENTPSSRKDTSVVELLTVMRTMFGGEAQV